MLTLQNSGQATCALPYNTGFVTIGGYGNRVFHGKVDRCSNHNCHHHHPLSVRGTTLKANTWIPFPTWPHLELTMAAPVSSPVTASRWKYPQVVQFSFFCISNRPCLSLEVLPVIAIYRALSCSQMVDGQQEETFPGENICQIIWIHHRYHFIINLLAMISQTDHDNICDNCWNHHIIVIQSCKQSPSKSCANAPWCVNLSKVLFSAE